jgi:RimJ/RimL family protein N-acetyltransferase
MAKGHWGRGYASGATRRALHVAFDATGPDEVISFTTPQIPRSRSVMARIGTTQDEADDFDNPRFVDNGRLRRHALYRIDRGERLAGRSGLIAGP